MPQNPIDFMAFRNAKTTEREQRIVRAGLPKSLNSGKLGW